MSDRLFLTKPKRKAGLFLMGAAEIEYVSSTPRSHTQKLSVAKCDCGCLVPKHVKLETKGMHHVKSIRCTCLVHLKPPTLIPFWSPLYYNYPNPSSYIVPLPSPFCVVVALGSMKSSSSSSYTSFFLATLFLLLTLGKGLRFTHHHSLSSSFHDGGKGQVNPEGEKEEEGDMRVYPTGSSLPDCSHACGPCTPCKRVMVSFKCSVAESCPIVYRCTCKGKYYHVPSN